MNNLKKRRESVATVCRKTTKFLTSNTANFLKKVPNTRKYRLLARLVEDNGAGESQDFNTYGEDNGEDADEDLGVRDLDYYLGVRKQETFWRDLAGRDQIRKDFFLYHRGLSEEDYDKLFSKPTTRWVSFKQPKLKQVPFKITRKKHRRNESLEGESWKEKAAIFKLFTNRKDSDTTSDSYSECDSSDEETLNNDMLKNDEEDRIWRMVQHFNELDTIETYEGVRIKEVSEGRPCDNCPELCPGFISHPWRKTCKSCGCDRLQHSVYHEELGSVRDRLGLRDTRVNHHAYDSPPGLTAKQTELFWSSLAERAPTSVGGATGSAAWRAWRIRALATQLPKQDLSLSHCRHIDEVHRKQFEDFVAARNEIALDIGLAYQHHGASIDCMACNKSIRNGSIAVQAPRMGEEVAYHPACFTCADCEELLVELAYCALDGQLYCVRHYSERLKPRCHACDEAAPTPAMADVDVQVQYTTTERKTRKVKKTSKRRESKDGEVTVTEVDQTNTTTTNDDGGEYTKAMNKDWHSGHFCCWQCDESLTGQRYVLRDEHPYCIKCYESVFANGCEECNKTIGIDSKDLSYKDKHWHEACFLCAKCRVSLVDKQFGSKLDKIYCGNCYDAQFASRCDGCGEVFRAGTKKMEYKTRQWHEKCFCCVVCKNPIGTKSFIPREQEIYCAGCYEDKFATRCVKCNKIITQGGVTYKNEPWHRECFTCTHCDTSLAGQRFTSRDDKPYCAECFGELFAKRCTSCTKPITGIGGTRFISFEDRHWHNDCFICAQCKTSLVGKGFITDGQDIICPECAKQKLM